MFEGSSLLTGLLLLAGILVNNCRGFVYAFWGAVLPLMVGLLASDFEMFNTGLYGYNGVLLLDCPSWHIGQEFRMGDSGSSVISRVAMGRNGGRNRYPDRSVCPICLGDTGVEAFPEG